METAREDIIKVTHLNKQFLVNKQPMEVLHDINLQVKKGEFITIVGHSGCGESKKTSGTCRIGRTSKTVIQASCPAVCHSVPQLPEGWQTIRRFCGRW